MNRLVACALILAGAASISAPLHADGAIPATASSMQAENPSAPPILLADEIIRRLRRLGLNFNRARVQRPYDPEGELC